MTRAFRLDELYVETAIPVFLAFSVIGLLQAMATLIKTDAVSATSQTSVDAAQ
jgi:hypothetical protein